MSGNTVKNGPRKSGAGMLLIVDPQIDFINGALRVSGAMEAMDRLSHFVDRNGGNYDVIVVTADKHPVSHCSFRENGGEWPRHCVAGTEGAEIWPSLHKSLNHFSDKLLLLYKGNMKDKDEYSIFSNLQDGVRLESLLNSCKVKYVDICGIAGDVCVADTLSDLVQRFPDLSVNILEEYSPSLDGGKKLTALAASILKTPDVNL